MAILLVKRSRTYVVIVQSITGFWLGKKGWQGGVVSYVIDKTVAVLSTINLENSLVSLLCISLIYL